jgi:hypothetical protein
MRAIYGLPTRLGRSARDTRMHPQMQLMRSSGRLEDAEAGKRAADAAAAAEAAKPGCKTNCAQLLSATQLRANEELKNARASAAALPRVQTTDGLAARLGIAPWTGDLWMAALRSVGVMGASIAVGLALHPRAQALRASPDASAAARPVQRNPPARITNLTANTKRSKASKRDVREHVSEFMVEEVRPDPTGNVSLRELHRRYFSWCDARATSALLPGELGRELRAIIDVIGLTCEAAGDDVVVRGARLAKQLAAAPMVRLTRGT